VCGSERTAAFLSDNPDVWTRVTLLLGLDNAIHQTLPCSTLSANLWVTSPNPRRSNQTPLGVMLAGGPDGIRRIERSADNLDPLTSTRSDLLKITVY
jgi:hypothetical protein